MYSERILDGRCTYLDPPHHRTVKVGKEVKGAPHLGTPRGQEVRIRPGLVIRPRCDHPCSSVHVHTCVVAVCGD